MLKKIIGISCGILCMCAVTASAKTALYSDIDTYINHYPISGYAVDGKMVVVAEDLRDYGFNVTYNDNERALHITRNTAVTSLVRKDIYDPDYPSGTKFSDIYESDIKVDYNGVRLQSYAINGYTLIPINDLAALAGKEEWLGDIRAYKVWIDGINICEYKPLKKRCINLWYDSNTYPYTQMPTLSLYEDMDSDGVEEKIKLSIDKIDDNYYISASLTIGDSKINDITMQGWTFGIDAVYLVDLIPNDKAKELAVFLDCESGDPHMKIFRYSDKKLETILFKNFNHYEGRYDIEDSLWTGNGYNYMFDLHEDGSFTMQTRSETLGMWHVYVTYKLNSQGILELVPQNEYTVVKKTGIDAYNEWGYHYVDKTLTGYGLPLYRGEWIKPIADDMNGNVLIQKSNGAKGWIHVGCVYTLNYSDKIHDASSLFWLAG